MYAQRGTNHGRRGWSMRRGTNHGRRGWSMRNRCPSPWEEGRTMRNRCPSPPWFKAGLVRKRQKDSSTLGEKERIKVGMCLFLPGLGLFYLREEV